MKLLMMIAAAAAIAGCAHGTSPSADGARLRITNVGPAAVQNLVVLFPTDRVSFGTVAVASTTGYRDVPHGVFSYAAYEFILNGRTVLQPVIDWVGETAMKGTAFTYTIEVASGSNGSPAIRLVHVNRDR